MRFNCNHVGVEYVEFPAPTASLNDYKHLHVTAALSNGRIWVDLISVLSFFHRIFSAHGTKSVTGLADFSKRAKNNIFYGIIRIQ